MGELNRVYTTEEIMEILPHRYPFLLVDRMLEVTEEGGKGYKNLTMNEEFFQGHFPGNPIMPGVLQIEGMAQCAAFIAMKLAEKKALDAGEEYKPKTVLFMGVNNCKFRRMVKPGDRLDYDVQIMKLSTKVGKFKTIARVGDDVAIQAELTAMMLDR